MQADTGCKINVSPGQEAEREIGLVGSRDAIERAKQAIMEKVHTVVSPVPRLVLRLTYITIAGEEQPLRRGRGRSP